MGKRKISFTSIILTSCGDVLPINSIKYYCAITEHVKHIFPPHFCVFPGCQLCTISYLGTLSFTDVAERWRVDRLWCHLCCSPIYLFFRLGLCQIPYAFVSWSFPFILFGMGGSSWFCDLLSFATSVLEVEGQVWEWGLLALGEDPWLDHSTVKR